MFYHWILSKSTLYSRFLLNCPPLTPQQRRHNIRYFGCWKLPWVPQVWHGWLGLDGWPILLHVECYPRWLATPWNEIWTHMKVSFAGMFIELEGPKCSFFLIFKCIQLQSRRERIWWWWWWWWHVYTYAYIHITFLTTWIEHEIVQQSSCDRCDHSVEWCWRHQVESVLSDLKWSQRSFKLAECKGA